MRLVEVTTKWIGLPMAGVVCLAASADLEARTGRSMVSLNESSYIKGKYSILDSAAVYITPRGQEFFSSKELPRILQNIKLDIHGRTVPIWSFESKKSIDLGHLPLGLKPYQSTMDTVRSSLNEWLAPKFTLKNPKLNAVAHQIEYASEHVDVQLQLDPYLSQQLTNNGVVVDVVMTFPDLKVWAHDVCGYDTQNPLFGTCTLQAEAWNGCSSKCLKEDKANTRDLCATRCLTECQASPEHAKNPEACGRYINGFALYHPWIKLADSTPLQLLLPVLVQMREDGGIDLLALKPQTNLDRLKYVTGQDRDILLPKVTFQVGTRVSEVDQAPLKQMILKEEPGLVRLGLHELQEFVIEQMPNDISDIAFEKLRESFDKVVEMTPPGGPDNATKIQWGMRPAHLGWMSGFAHPGNFVYLGLNGYLWDPQDPTSIGPALGKETHLPPRLATLKPNEYDFAIAANLKAINKMIELGYNRGYLDQTQIGEDDNHHPQYANIVDGSPVMRPGPNNHGILHLVLQLRRSHSIFDWQEIFALKDPYRVSLDIEFYTRSAGYRSYELVIDHIDPTTAHVLDQDIDHAKDSVAKTVVDKINKINQGLISKPVVIAGPFDLSTDFFGLTYHNVRAAVDENGYLVFYMAFGDDES